MDLLVNMSKMSGPNDIQIFVRVAELGSFTKAAKDLGVSKSAVSREIDRLEERLGARLLQRTTRSVNLTDAGTTYFERCKSILEQIEEAELAVTNLQSLPSGTLRVSLPLSYGRMLLMPHIHQFVSEHDKLNIDLGFTDRRVDLVSEGLDLAVRIGSNEEPNLITSRLGNITFIVCASPKYLENSPELKYPKDLRHHHCVEFTHRYHSGTWRFKGPQGQEVPVRIKARAQADLGEALVDAAKAGIGIAYVPTFLANEALNSGELLPLLTEWVPDPVPVWAIYPHNRHLSAKVRMLVERLRKQFAIS